MTPVDDEGGELQSGLSALLCAIAYRMSLTASDGLSGCGQRPERGRITSLLAGICCCRM